MVQDRLSDHRLSAPLLAPSTARSGTRSGPEHAALERPPAASGPIGADRDPFVVQPPSSPCSPSDLACVDDPLSIGEPSHKSARTTKHQGAGDTSTGELSRDQLLHWNGNNFSSDPADHFNSQFQPPSSEPVAAEAVSSAADVVIVTVGDLSGDMDGIPKIDGEPPQGLKVGALHISGSTLLQEAPPRP